MAKKSPEGFYQDKGTGRYVIIERGKDHVVRRHSVEVALCEHSDKVLGTAALSDSDVRGLKRVSIKRLQNVYVEIGRWIAEAKEVLQR